jgi:hypothetical protein
LLLYYARAVNNKLLVALSAIADCQSCATVATEQAVHLLLDYVATYPSDGIIYQSSNMILCAHSNSGFLNETNSCSCARAHIFLSENDPLSRFNGAVLSIAQIIKFVMASATKCELAALFVTVREMIPHWQTLIAMGWPQPKVPIQMDNSTATGVTNKKIVPRQDKIMDMRFWWLCCGAPQDQFCYYWDAGSKNWANYHTKHHPDTYHKAHQKYSCRHLGPGRHLTLLPLSPNHRPTGFSLQVFPFYFSFLLNIISPHYECCRKDV